MLSFMQMRLLDRYLGGFLCRCFYLINWLARLAHRRPQEEPAELRKILVMKYFGIGSLVLASPMVRALRQRYPAARINLLTTDQNRIIAEVMPIFDDVITISLSSLRSVVMSMARALWDIRREKYDAVIDAEFFSRLSTLVSYFTRSRYTVGFYLPEIWRGNFLTHPVHFNYYRHAVLAFVALAKSLGATTESLCIEPVPVSDQVKSNVRAQLQGLGVRPGQRLVCVNVSTGPLSPERRWPEKHFVELIRRVLREFSHVTVILIGAACDVPLVTQVHNQFGAEEQKRVFNLAGRFDLRGLCGLLRLSELLVTNDSGPLHIAEALRTPTVSFFGPETPLLYGPTGDHHEVFYKGIYCSPCLNVQNLKKAPCNGNNVCMKLISVDEVFASVRRLFEGRPTTSPFRVPFDVPARELLTDYRSRDWHLSVVPAAVRIAVARQGDET